jgi:small GTP-binding protein
MSRWRIIVVVTLLGLPFAALAAVGSIYLLTTPWGFLTFWGVVGCMALGYFLAAYWQARRQLLRPPDFTAPAHWTRRDKEAWKLVEERARRGAGLDPTKLTDFQFYASEGQEMARELAAVYHPGEPDPTANLTVPEILAVIELASHDLAEMVEQYMPAGHLLRIKDFRLARRAADWYQTANNVYWALSAVFAPVNTALRYGASRLGIQTPLQMLQNNLLLWFHSAFVNRLGTYLIDLESGRLRVGAARYRELVKGRPPTPADAEAPPAPDGHPPAAPPEASQTTITILGQVKAGKSSLLNALLGEERARTDALPATADVARYELKSKHFPTKLVLLDTAGYGHAGPKADQLRATAEAARQSDALLLVTHANNPARQADLDMLKQLREWFDARPELKEPPVLAVVTHIDLLKPMMEWAPPYHWQEPKRPKEQSIQDAVAHVRQQLGEQVTDAIPVCVAAGKVYGVEEWLLPAMAAKMDEAHGVAMLRCLKDEVDAGKISRVFGQLLASAREAARIVWNQVKK